MKAHPSGRDLLPGEALRPGTRFARSLTRVAIVTLAMSGAAHAADQTVELFSSAFLPQSVTINLGDTVTWTWVAGTHLLQSGTPGGAPGTVDEPGAIFEAIIDASNPTFSYTFTTPGVSGYTFFDATNPSQIGFIEVLGDDLTFIVTVLDNVFEPEVHYVFEGDSIRWEHEPGEMLHTVTSGASSDPADNPGALFDEESSDSDPVFIYTFADDGVYPYFCRPHEALQMNGTIFVQRRFTRGDVDFDGNIAINDPIATLGFLFLGDPTPCEDAHDVNDDGSLDLSDVISSLSYVFAGGAAPAAPFPGLGPDRTSDALTCF